jgi:hypothetical protein
MSVLGLAYAVVIIWPPASVSARGLVSQLRWFLLLPFNISQRRTIGRTIFKFLLRVLGGGSSSAGLGLG